MSIRLVFLLPGVLVFVMQPGRGSATQGAETPLDQRLAQLRADGQPTKIEELKPEPIPAQQNAAVQLENAAELIEAFAADYRGFFNSPMGVEYNVLEESGLPPTAEQLDAIGEILLHHAELDRQIRRAWRCQGYASQLDFSLSREEFFEALSPRVNRMRTVARFVQWQMLIATEREQLDKALADGVALLHLVRLHENEPSMVSFLVSVACRQVACDSLNKVLRRGPLRPESRDLLDQELKRHRGLGHLPQVLRTERAVGLDGELPSARGLRNAVMKWRFGDWRSDLLDYYEAELKLIERPWHRGQGLIGKTADYHPVVQTMIPAVKACYSASNRDLVTQRCLRVVNALGRFRQKHGREARGLAELNLPAETTTDPYTGKALLVRRTDFGWLVYSAFDNQVDDNGNLAEHKDWGLGPSILIAD